METHGLANAYIAQRPEEGLLTGAEPRANPDPALPALSLVENEPAALRSRSSDVGFPSSPPPFTSGVRGFASARQASPSSTLSETLKAASMPFAEPLADNPGNVMPIPEWIAGTAGEGQDEALVAFVDFSHYVEPVYPRSLRRRGVEGFVELLLRVDPRGHVIDWEITDFGPVAAFKEEVERVAPHWRFPATGIHGVAEGMPSHRRVRIEFTLE